MSKKNKFFFNPKNPKTSFDIYKDKNPQDTVNIKYSTKKETEDTVKKIESLYKKGTIDHRRAVQIALILMLRTRIIAEKNPKIDKGRSKIAKSYHEFLTKKRTPIKNQKERKKLKFF